MSTLSVRCLREEQTAKERTGYPPSYIAEAMKFVGVNTSPMADSQIKHKELLLLFFFFLLGI